MTKELDFNNSVICNVYKALKVGVIGITQDTIFLLEAENVEGHKTNCAKFWGVIQFDYMQRCIQENDPKKALNYIGLNGDSAAVNFDVIFSTLSKGSDKGRKAIHLKSATFKSCLQNMLDRIKHENITEEVLFVGDIAGFEENLKETLADMSIGSIEKLMKTSSDFELEREKVAGILKGHYHEPCEKCKCSIQKDLEPPFTHKPSATMEALVSELQNNNGKLWGPNGEVYSLKTEKETIKEYDGMTTKEKLYVEVSYRGETQRVNSDYLKVNQANMELSTESPSPSQLQSENEMKPVVASTSVDITLIPEAFSDLIKTTVHINNCVEVESVAATFLDMLYQSEDIKIDESIKIAIIFEGTVMTFEGMVIDFEGPRCLIDGKPANKMSEKDFTVVMRTF